MSAGTATQDNAARLIATLPLSHISALPGVYIPPSWGQFIAPKLAAGTGHVALVGDSVTQGFWASNLQTTSWAALLRAALHTAYGDGGSGFHSGANNKEFLTSNAEAANTYYEGKTANYWTKAGTWALCASKYGPGYAVMEAKAESSTIELAFSGTELTIYYLNGGPGFTFKVDGGSTHLVTAGGGYGLGNYALAKTTVTGLATGSHTVVVTTAWATSGGNHEGCYINGFRGTSATGVIVDNYGVGGKGSTLPNNAISPTAAGFNTGLWMGGLSQPCDMVIYAMGANDVNFEDTAPDTYMQNIQTYLAGVLDTSMGNGTTGVTSFGGSQKGETDIVFLLPHWGQYDTHNFRAQYGSRLRGLAEQYGAMLIDIGTLGRQSWSYWHALGYWGNPEKPSEAGEDPVHPCDAGHKYTADRLIEALSIGLQNRGLAARLTLP